MKPLVIVTHHLNKNDEFLDLCLSSIEANEADVQTICVSDTKNPIKERKNVLYHSDNSLDNATKKIKWAINEFPSSQYYILLSDDIILSRNAIFRMIYTTEGKHITFPMCYQERGFYRVERRFYDKETSELMHIPMGGPIETSKKLYSHVVNSIDNTSGHINVPWSPFAAVCIPKSTWDLVGGLDENLTSRGDDVAFCIEAARHGIERRSCLGSYYYHAIHQSLCEEPVEKEQEALVYFQHKYNMGL